MSMDRVNGKVAVVTGGSLGIGQACCRLLAREGASVAIVDLLEAEGAALADKIRAAGGRAKFWRMDVASESSVKSTISAIVAEFGRIDVLVNNAGIIGANKPTHELTEQEWDAVQAVNVKGVFFCTKHTVPHMIAGGGGSIINLSSIYGLVGAADLPPYHASKGAVRLMTKTDAMIYAKNGIRVNSIHPGAIMTPMLEQLFASAPDPAAAQRAMAEQHPLGRIGVPDDIAYAVLYLASDESGFVTGEELVIDGGYTAH
jgi:NAD(P)-dependent dehydrogenase (short-subunit alcohol dehydrogenase family)